MMKKFTLLICFTACIHLSSSLMKLNEFYESNLLRCYDTNAQDSRRISQSNIHGQALPLPNSIETFVSIIEQYESLNPTAQVRDTIQKLLQSFRIDDLDPDLDDRQLRETSADTQNTIKRSLLNIPQNARYVYGFGNDDFTDDEKCALHLMLSHTINDTRVNEAAEFNPNKAKQPLELGVVSLNAKWNHAFALGRVLMGIHAAYLPNKDVKTNTLLQTLKLDSNSELDNVNVNPVYAVTMGDLVSRLAPKDLNDEIKILPNGMWNDISCPIQYQLSDNNGAFVTLSELRGGMDGLIIGKKIQENKETYNDIKLSQILRMYYGYYGLLDNERSRWCNRERALQSFTDLQDEMVNYNKFFKVVSGGLPGPKIIDQVNKALSEIKNNAIKDMDAPECSIQENSADRKFTSPYNVFAILDFANSGKMQFQREVLGNLSVNFDVRPRGNLYGVYTNMKPLQQNMLDTIVKNNGTAGCPSCFATYYQRTSNKEEENEVIRDLNATFTTFEVENEALQMRYQDPRGGSPGRVVLYFNYGSTSNDYRLQNALWDFRRYYGGATFLAVGENKDSLKLFVDNEDMDIFIGSTNAEKTAKDIKDRLRKVPGEFQFKACDQSSPSKETENKQEVFITPNKMQYWAMYPQYFLKSFDVRLKFKAQDGTQIQVCHTRWFPSLLNNDRNVYCQTSSGEEIEFRATDPCKKRNVYNCEPFFFSVEAKKQPVDYCKSLRCNTPRDIQFEFRHEGVSCNMASFMSISNMVLILAAILFYIQRY